MKNRHILLANIFFAPFSYGGATVVAEQVARALRRDHGARVSAVSLCRRSDVVPYALIKAEVGGIVNYLINVPGHTSYAEIYDNPRVTEAVARLIDQLEPDLLHVHCIQDMGAGLLQAAKLKGVPVILSVHDFWWICDRQFMIKPNQSYCGQDPVRIEACRGCVEDFSAASTRFAYLQKQADHADLITYPSRFALELCEASGFGPGKGCVWGNGITPPGPDFLAAQAARRAADQRVTFGFLGGPSQIKGWPIIRRTFVDLDRDDFAGLLVDASLDQTWWKGHDLTKLRGDWQVHPRFSQDDMDAFYAKIDVLLFMSQWKETFGLAIREAVARGIRVIQTDSGGTTEHPVANPADLIPIGAGAAELRAQVIRALDSDPAQIEPQPVDSFADQARDFSDLVDTVLAAHTH